MTTVALQRVRGLELERHFARLGSSEQLLLCTSDVEPYRLDEVLEFADPVTRELWVSLSLGYTAPAGYPLLRQEIAGLYDEIEPEHVVTFAGADEAIFLALNAILRDGDHAIVVWPAYQALDEVARAAGADVTRLPLDPEHWELDPEALRRAIRPSTRLIVVNFPHNPTGALPSQETFDAILAIAAEANAYLFSDEVYRFLEHDPRDRLPAAADYGGRAVSVGVMSKAFGLAGLRIGWLATRDAELLERVSIFREYVSTCNSAPSEILALVALRERDRVLGRSRSLIAANLVALDAFFARWGGIFECVRPAAGCVGFPRLCEGLDVEELVERLAIEERVLLVPGSVYESGENRFRLGFGRACLPEALERLDSFATRWVGSGR